MAKAKSKATILVTDGAGGMAKVPDRRFEACDWPIRVDVPREQADSWLKYFYAQCEKRRWSSSGIGQFEARENSGSITVNSGGADNRQLAVVWERKLAGPLQVRARSAGVPEFPLTDAREFFDRVNEQCRSGATERIYRRYQLEYDGLPWRGEFWLDDTLRLGPPSRQDETALLGPRVIIVEALVECVGQSDAGRVFDRELRELSAFLSVVLGTAVHIPEQGRVWTWANGVNDCDVRQLGYWEQENRQEMPARGTCRVTPLKPITRPDFSERGIDGSIDEQSLPEDIADLWGAYRALTPDQRRKFLQAAAKWQEALSHWRERSTLSFALLVVACESLKPAGAQFREHIIYDVVEALLGKASADRLREHWFRPQDVRNAHLHSGEFRGSEFVHAAITSSYHDPTFDQARRALTPIAQAAIIEWLRRRGTFTMPLLQRKTNFRRWVKEHILVILPSVFAIGLFLGWLLRMFWGS